MPWADAWGVLDEARRRASGSGDRTDAVEAAQGARPASMSRRARRTVLWMT
jgi:hypothetical protein